MRVEHISPVLDQYNLHARVHAYTPETDVAILENIYTEEKVEVLNTFQFVDALHTLDKLGLLKKGI